MGCSPPPLPTVAELPPAVCFHTLAHCILPVTLDGCPAAAAEAVLPAPSPARWVVPSGPGPPSLLQLLRVLSHIWLHTLCSSLHGPGRLDPQGDGHPPSGPLGEGQLWHPAVQDNTDDDSSCLLRTYEVTGSVIYQLYVSLSTTL